MLAIPMLFRDGRQTRRSMLMDPSQSCKVMGNAKRQARSEVDSELDIQYLLKGESGTCAISYVFPYLSSRCGALDFVIGRSIGPGAHKSAFDLL
jgi:hypothetical protein